MRQLLLTFLLCSTWMFGQSKISDNQIRTPPPLQCSDVTTSGTTQTCTTAPSFTPAAKDCVTYNTTTTNTGALTLNVNSQGAKPVQKWLGSALVAGDVVANKPQLACYDGTNWQLSTIGNAPGTGSGNVTAAGTLTSHGVVLGAGTTAVGVTAVGTTGQVLTGNTGADPTWQAAAGGGCTSGVNNSGLCLLEEHTASSSAELDFTACLSNSSYDDFQIRVVNLVPATNNVGVLLQVSTNGGSSYDTTSGHYIWQIWYTQIGGGTTGNANNGTFFTVGGFAMGMENASNSAVTASPYFVFDLASPASSTFFKQALIHGMFQSQDNVFWGQNGSGYFNQTTAVNAFRVIATSGNLASGTVRCYGVTK